MSCEWLKWICFLAPHIHTHRIHRNFGCCLWMGGAERPSWITITRFGRHRKWTWRFNSLFILIQFCFVTDCVARRAHRIRLAIVEFSIFWRSFFPFSILLFFIFRIFSIFEVFLFFSKFLSCQQRITLSPNLRGRAPLAEFNALRHLAGIEEGVDSQIYFFSGYRSTSSYRSAIISIGFLLLFFYTVPVAKSTRKNRRHIVEYDWSYLVGFLM